MPQHVDAQPDQPQDTQLDHDDGDLLCQHRHTAEPIMPGQGEQARNDRPVGSFRIAGENKGRGMRRVGLQGIVIACESTRRFRMDRFGGSAKSTTACMPWKKFLTNCHSSRFYVFERTGLHFGRGRPSLERRRLMLA